MLTKRLFYSIFLLDSIETELEIKVRPSYQPGPSQQLNCPSVIVLLTGQLHRVLKLLDHLIEHLVPKMVLTGRLKLFE